MNWMYYNHAAIPVTAPHEKPDLEAIENGSVWKLKGKPLFARWVSDWDCGTETGWWYVIKDSPFDINELKSKRRYEINKGNKNFEIRKIQPKDYVQDLFDITIKAYSSWPEKYRPKMDKDQFYNMIDHWNNCDVFGAFSRETGELCGYAQLSDRKSYVEFSILRVDPEKEKLAINAAIVYGILEYYKDRFDGMFYINDGSRSIRHETAFQDYLEKYFGFRKAYCKLNMYYRKWFGIIVHALYPARKLIKGKTNLGSRIKGILLMEEIRRNKGDLCDE